MKLVIVDHDLYYEQFTRASIKVMRDTIDRCNEEFVINLKNIEISHHLGKPLTKEAVIDVANSGGAIFKAIIVSMLDEMEKQINEGIEND